MQLWGEGSLGLDALRGGGGVSMLLVNKEGHMYILRKKCYG